MIYYIKKLKTKFINVYLYITNIYKINEINLILEKPKEKFKKNIIIQIDHKGQYQHVEGIINLILDNNGYNNIILSSNSDLSFIKKKINKKKRVILVDGKLSKFLRNIFICLKCNFEDKSPKGSISIFLGHGFLVKRKLIPKDYLEDIDHVFLYGPSSRSIFNSYLKNVGLNKKKIKFWNTGYPNYDDLINTNYDINKIKKKLFLAKKNSILFSPAWENHHELYKNLDKLCLIFSRIKKYNFIIKVHPNWLIEEKNYQKFYFYSGGYNWKKKLQSMQKKFDNIYFYEDLKIFPLFDICKLMITDFSGVGIGFALKKKPVIFLNNFNHHKTNLLKLGYEKKINNLLLEGKKNLGIEMNDYYQIENSIDKIFSNYKFYQKKLNNFQKKHLYNPGRATDIAYKYLNLIEKF
jgi:hypothetical protein